VTDPRGGGPRPQADRLFYALWPDEALRQRLLSRLPPLTAGIDVRPQRPDQWHVTLEFLGQVPRERQPLLAAVAAAASVVAPFAVRFDRLEFWRRPGVLCLASTYVPPPLLQLVAALRDGLAAGGFATEARGFRPHVTLARKVRRAPDAVLADPVDWPAAGFALVRSVTDPAGSRYEPLARWNLSPAGG
jgi:2'-5' RNA ligase